MFKFSNINLVINYNRIFNKFYYLLMESSDDYNLACKMFILKYFLHGNNIEPLKKMYLILIRSTISTYYYYV